MNNLGKRRQRVGEWMKEYGIEPGKTVLWPMNSSLAASILEDAEAENIVGLYPGGYPLPSGDRIETEDSSTHEYDGTDFDLEYGWAIADDVTNTIEPLIDPENNLHQYEYPDRQERDEALNTAFSCLTDTTDRLLNDRDATVMYNLESINRYELPSLAESCRQNQIEYGRRIASHLKERGFDTEIIEDSEYSKHTHVIGLR